MTATNKDYSEQAGQYVSHRLGEMINDDTDGHSISEMFEIIAIDQRAEVMRLQAENAELRKQLEMAKTESKALHVAIESFWIKQCAERACGCGAHPECLHTINASELRKAAMTAELRALSQNATEVKP